MAKMANQYCALSYCAGARTDSEPMLVDGRPFNAFANLAHAIEQVFRYWQKKNPGKELYLWTDQICIDQNNQKERTSQVGLMRNIYYRASETFICLSNPKLGRCLDWTLSCYTVAQSEPADEQFLRSLHAFMESPWWRRSCNVPPLFPPSFVVS